MVSASFLSSLVIVALWLTLSDTKSIFQADGCANVPGQATLDVSKYLGKWYEYERFPAIFEAGLECTSAEYALETSKKISVLNKGQLRVRVSGKTIVVNNSTIQGNATVPDPTKPAELAVVFFAGQPSDKANYFIQDTDYKTYSVIYSCTEIFGIKFEYSWILTRERGVAPKNLTQLEKNLAARGVDISPFFVVNQTACV